MKRISYGDNKVIVKGRVAYLRTKYDRQAGHLTYTLRTQAAGKGAKIAQASGTLSTRVNESVILWRLYKKCRFQFVQLTTPEKPI